MGTQKNRLIEAIYDKTDGNENIRNFTLKLFVYLDLWIQK